MKKLRMMLSVFAFVFLLVIFIQGSSSGAGDSKTFNSVDGKYGSITVKDGVDTTRAYYKLLKSADFCDEYCWAEGEAILFETNVLFQSLDFKDRDNNWINLRNSKILLGENISETFTVPNYVEDCSGKNCTLIQSGTKKVTQYRMNWTEYNGEVLTPGVYDWRVQGSKAPNQAVDFQLKAFGIHLDEWLWWNETGNHETVWREDFEGPLDTAIWTHVVEIGSGDTTAVNVYNGSESYQADDTGSGVISINRSNEYLNSSSHFYQMAIAADSFGNWQTDFMDDDGTLIWRIGFADGSGNLDYIGNGTNTLVSSPTINQFYLIQLDIDFPARNMTIYVDGVNKGKFGFFNDAINITQFKTFTGNAVANDGFIDEIQHRLEIASDTTNPLIDFTAAATANNSIQNSQNITLDITVTEENEDTVTFSLFQDSCYQEFANQSTECGNPSVGIHETTSDSHFYVNYSKPSSATSATWQVQHGNNLAAYNVSVPDTCFSFDSEFLIFRFFAYKIAGGRGQSVGFCMNSSGWSPITLVRNTTEWTSTPGDVPGNVYDGDWDTSAAHLASGSAWTSSSIAFTNGAQLFEEAIIWNGRIALNISTFTDSRRNFNFTNLADGTYFFNASVNDTAGNANETEFRTVTIDTTVPLISFTSSTPTNNSGQKSRNITVDVSVTEANEDAIIFSLYNTSTQLNTSSFTDSRRNINFTNLSDGTYFINVTVNDTATNSNKTETRTIIIDNVQPTVALISPETQTNLIIDLDTTPLNITVEAVDDNLETDGVGRYAKISFFLQNDSTFLNDFNLGIVSGNRSASTFEAADFSSFGETTYKYNITINDSANNLVVIQGNFTYSGSPPSITLNSPSSGSEDSDGFVTFGYTVTSLATINSCSLYIENKLESTDNSITNNATQTFSVQDPPVLDSMSWFVGCNDSLARQANSTTFNLKTKSGGGGAGAGGGGATTPAPSTTDGGFDSGAPATSSPSTNAVDADGDGSFTGANDDFDGDGILNSEDPTPWATDINGDGDFTDLTDDFDGDGTENQVDTTPWGTNTIAQYPAGAGGGGGGATGITRTEIPVIGLNSIDSENTYSALEREIIYAVINNYCYQKITGQDSQAIMDFSEDCILTLSELAVIQSTLLNLGVDVTTNDLKLFAQAYKNNDVFQGLEDKQTVEDLELFMSILGTIESWRLLPPSLDSPVLIFPAGEGEVVVEKLITSNKDLKSCEVINGAPDLVCETTTNSVKIFYTLNHTDFFSEVFTGSITVINTDSELKTVPITLRVYNANYKVAGVPVLIIPPAIILAIVAFVVFRKGSKKTFKSIKELTKLS